MGIHSKYKHIIWDWNGTLLDDAWLFVEVMNVVLTRYNLATINIKKYRELFGFPVRDYYIKLGFDFQKIPFEISGTEFIKGYENRRYDAELYPQVIPLLTEFQKRGISHSILSAQHQNFLNILEKSILFLQVQFVNKVPAVVTFSVLILITYHSLRLWHIILV